MKKYYIFVLVALLLLSAVTAKAASTAAVNFTVIEKSYKVSDTNQFVSVDIKINNKLKNDIYFQDVNCRSSLQVYQLSPKSNWVLRPELTKTCTGLGPSADVPRILKSGGNINSTSWPNALKQGISKAGVYKIKFTYYLNEDDYKNRTSSQNIYSNQFTIKKIKATKKTTIDACKAADSRESRLIECLYSAAKNSATTDLNLSLSLCKEITSIYKGKKGFDGCYDGVALILSRNKLKNKVSSVCKNYVGSTKINQCLNMAK